MIPRIVNVWFPSIVPSTILLSACSPFRFANSSVTISESGCARNTSGSSITASSPLSRS